MKLNVDSIMEDVRKIGVALVVGALLAGLLKESGFFNIAYPFILGVALITIGSMTNEDDNHE